MKKKKKKIKNTRKIIEKFSETIKEKRNPIKVLRVPDIEISEDSEELIKPNF